MQKRNYKGSLRLDWINKGLSLYYEIDEKEGKGVRPVWVSKNDIRVAEPRILRFVKDYGDKTSDNMLIKGDNLLVLRSLVEMFKGRPNKEKVKCIYIDPPFNTGNAFKYYDDNLQHSEWLTMMRDRLWLLKKILRKGGFLAVHINNDEMPYLRVILDEIFSREGYVTQICWERSQRTALGQGASSINDTVEYVLIYTNDPLAKLNKLQKFYEIEERTIRQYSKRIVSFGKRKIFKESKDSDGNPITIFELEEFKIKSVSMRDFEKRYVEIYKELLDNFDSAVRLSNQQKESTFQQKVLSDFKANKTYVVEYIPKRGKNKGKKTEVFYHGKDVVLFLKNYARKEQGVIWKLDDMNNFWTRKEISMAGVASEGKVDFRRSKKPEKLIQRVIELCSGENDFVFDSFAGSGTTGAVAHKMNRRWIMVEFGRNADELIIPRMQRVITGKDQTGISKDVNWQGGGGFKYYQLGESVIYEQDMNWKLKAEEMAEAVFLHFQYRPTDAKWLEKESMYLGRHQSARYHFAISFASREIKTLTADLYEKIVAELEREKFKHLTIFTNVAVSVPPESLNDRVLVKKIPAAILREYNLL
ncbi:MAG: methylase N-4/N-6 domain protein [Candidatus Pacebacteria bacterium GW2011_GWB1_47_8]|nr:MAG: methylase N-4/N-6 domain protein [Candidatus Pacebacteria bacterium GW2011_GWA1_46_10]KKU84241.1 MAG: methylase N-4/N-6 domain protein [Candidatus Pacebacteria bacterium GW2011_GWB1_47_8]HCR81461.1 hypothetical protein [Candidatus Paceibacterota bacterium]